MPPTKKKKKDRMVRCEIETAFATLNFLDRIKLAIDVIHAMCLVLNIYFDIIHLPLPLFLSLFQKRCTV